MSSTMSMGSQDKSYVHHQYSTSEEPLSQRSTQAWLFSWSPNKCKLQQAVDPISVNYNKVPIVSADAADKKKIRIFHQDMWYLFILYSSFTFSSISPHNLCINIKYNNYAPFNYFLKSWKIHFGNLFSGAKPNVGTLFRYFYINLCLCIYIYNYIYIIIFIIIHIYIIIYIYYI